MEPLRRLYLGSMLHKCRQSGAQSVSKSIEMERFGEEELITSTRSSLIGRNGTNQVRLVRSGAVSNKVYLPCHILFAA